MTAVGVAGVLAAIGVPALNTWIQNQRLVTATNALVISLNYARSEAVKRDSAQGVELCTSSDSQTCSNSTNWAQGWIVEDVASATVLSAAPALGNSITVQEAAAQTAVTYLPNGAVSAPAEFTACDSRGATYAHELEVNTMGRIVTASTPGQTVSGATGMLVCPAT